MRLFACCRLEGSVDLLPAGEVTAGFLNGSVGLKGDVDTHGAGLQSPRIGLCVINSVIEGTRRRSVPPGPRSRQSASADSFHIIISFLFVASVETVIDLKTADSGREQLKQLLSPLLFLYVSDYFHAIML